MKSAFRPLILLLTATVGLEAAPYKVETRYAIGGVGGWDYITVDSAARRLYVSHGTRVNVLDADTGKGIGVIEDTPGIHGIAIASSSQHGFTSNGKEDKVSMFNTGDLSLIKKIEVGKGPDGIFFDERTNRVFTNNHGSHNITAIDAAKGEVVGTVKIGGDGEGIGLGKDGLIYVALEDKNELSAFDPKTLEVKRHIALDGITAPTGLAIDTKNDRFFVGGHNKMAVVLDGATGRKIVSFATGTGTDAAGWDEQDGLAFISNGEGTISVIQEKSANEFVALTPIQTQTGAKTMAFDSNTGKIFLPTATVVITPTADPTQKPKRTITEGSFVVLVVGKQQ
jgi:DNA-binding beta-propeller fold protein YncE